MNFLFVIKLKARRYKRIGFRASTHLKFLHDHVSRPHIKYQISDYLKSNIPFGNNAFQRNYFIVNNCCEFSKSMSASYS